MEGAAPATPTEDPSNAGVRREPELPVHEDIVSGPRKPAQEFELDTNALRQAFAAAESWAKENLDEDVLRALQQVDREKVEQFLRDYQKGLQGEYVLDLAALKDAELQVEVLEKGVLKAFEMAGNNGEADDDES